MSITKILLDSNEDKLETYDFEVLRQKLTKRFGKFFLQIEKIMLKIPFAESFILVNFSEF